MSDDERERIRRAGQEAGRRAAEKQGLPPKLTDRATIDRVAALVRDANEAEEAA